MKKKRLHCPKCGGKDIKQVEIQVRARVIKELPKTGRLKVEVVEGELKGQILYVPKPSFMPERRHDASPN
jgi:cytochrome c-type biogenesis protein CcmH/NrfF